MRMQSRSSINSITFGISRRADKKSCILLAFSKNERLIVREADRGNFGFALANMNVFEGPDLVHSRARLIISR
jgi:hypothetical protein